MIRFSAKAIKLPVLGEKKAKICHMVGERLLPLCEPYVPKESGKLAGTGKLEGGNKLTWNTRYARQQLYHGKGKGKRGKKWVFRAWHKNKRYIVREVKAAL